MDRSCVASWLETEPTGRGLEFREAEEEAGHHPLGQPLPLLTPGRLEVLSPRSATHLHHETAPSDEIIRPAAAQGYVTNLEMGDVEQHQGRHDDRGHLDEAG